MVRLGVNLVTATEDAEKMFSLPPRRRGRNYSRGVAKNARRVLVGADAKGLDLMQRLMPAFYQRLVQRGMKLRLKS